MKLRLFLALDNLLKMSNRTILIIYLQKHTKRCMFLQLVCSSISHQPKTMRKPKKTTEICKKIDKKTYIHKKTMTSYIFLSHPLRHNYRMIIYFILFYLSSEMCLPFILYLHIYNKCAIIPIRLPLLPSPFVDCICSKLIRIPFFPFL